MREKQTNLPNWWKSAPKTIQRACSDDFTPVKRAFEGCYRTARHAWPEVRLESEVFCQFVAERLPAALPWPDCLESLCTDELYLVCACAQGLPHAVAVFENRYGRDIRMALVRMNLDRTRVDEVCQRVLTKLFIARDKKPGKIIQFRGKGDLRCWLRVVSLREAVNSLRHGQREILTEDAELPELIVPEEDPELRFLKKTAQGQFRIAFAEALESLDSRERTLLKYSVLDGLAVEQIGQIFKVHRVTAARWLMAIRKKIFTETRRTLQKLLKLERSEFDSLVRLIRSEMDVSLRRILQSKESKTVG